MNFGDKFGEILFFRDLPSEISDRFLARIMDLSIPLDISLHFTAMDQAEAMDTALDENGNFDFGKIRPVPKSLLMEESPRTDAAMSAAEARRRGDLAELERVAEEAHLPWSARPTRAG